MDLKNYFDRIGFSGDARPDLATLKQVHRQHLLAIPYENVDVQLGRSLDLDPGRIYNKIVEQHRGGWCYEMNGLLGWALSEIGFDVTRACGGVNRAERGDDAIGNHLVLLVQIDNDDVWVADAGFGDGVIEPMRLAGARFKQRGFDFALDQQADGYWRFSNHQHGGAPSFDFRAEAGDEALLAAKCQFLQTSDESVFVNNLIAQRFVEGGYAIQVGRIARTITRDGVRSEVLPDMDSISTRLRSVFGIDEPALAECWPRIQEVHRQHFPDELGSG